MSLARIPFTKEDEDVIRSLAGWMLFVTIVVNFIACGIGVIFSCLGGVGAVSMFNISVAQGAFTMLNVVFLMAMCITYIAQGVILVQARGSLRAVSDTDHSDQAHLATAFRKLRVVFLIEVIFAVLSLLMQLITLISSFVLDVPVGGMPGGGGGFGGGGGYGGGGGFGGGM